MCEMYRFEVSLYEDTVNLSSARTFMAKLSDVIDDLPLGFLSFSKSEPDSTQMAPLIQQSRKRAKMASEPIKRVKTQSSIASVVPSVAAPGGAKRDVSSLIDTVIKPGTAERVFQCSFCAYQSANNSHVKRHIELKHVTSNVVFKCQMCDKAFSLKSNLKRHYLTAHKMPPAAADGMLTS